MMTLQSFTERNAAFADSALPDKPHTQTPRTFRCYPEFAKVSIPQLVATDEAVDLHAAGDLLGFIGEFHLTENCSHSKRS